MKPHYNFKDKNTVRAVGIVSQSGAVYDLMLDGSIHRVTPVRPYRGKSERRAVIKWRREEKAP